MDDPLPSWFVRLIDERFDGLEKRQGELALDISKRQDDMQGDTARQLVGIRDAQRHLDECLDKVKKALAADAVARATEQENHSRRLVELERIVHGAAALLLTAALLLLGDRFIGRPDVQRTPAAQYPTTPYRGQR